jgi:hypothetical protein
VSSAATDARDRAGATAVAAAVALCGLVAGIFPVFESDLFWHLATGRWILAHGALPRVDPFRFTSGGAPWIDHEWLFQMVAIAVERLGGLDGLILARAAALAGFALLLHGSARRAGLAPWLTGLVALGATLGVRPRFLMRPEIVTLYAVVLLPALLERAVARLPERSWTALAAPVALTVVWVQFHGEALLAPVLAFLFLLGAARSGRGTVAPDGARPPSWREVAGIPALLALALLANPYGWRLIEVPLGIAGALDDLPAVNPEWASAWAAPQPYLFGGLAATAAVALLARRRLGRWPAPGWALPAAALGLLALTAVRHQALFYAAAAPYLSRCLAAFPEARRTTRGGAVATIASAALLALWCAFPPASGPLRPRHGGLSWGFGLAPGRFPEHAAATLAAHPGIGPLYNEFVHGGYLLWRLFPPRRVFLDGRMELDPELLAQTARARASAKDWDAFLSREGASGALVRYDERRQPVLEPDGRGGFRQVDARTPNALLFPADRWELADWDDETMLFLRPDDPAWTAPPYRAVQPEDLGWTLRRAAADPRFRAAALAEVERKLADQPACRRARWLRDQLEKLP